MATIKNLKTSLLKIQIFYSPTAENLLYWLSFVPAGSDVPHEWGVLQLCNQKPAFSASATSANNYLNPDVT